MKSYFRKIPIAMLGAAMAVLSGCQTIPSRWSDETRATIDADLDKMKSSNAKMAVPSDVRDALLPPIDIALPGGKVAPVEPRFDLSVANAPARQVFIGLVEGTPYDIVVHPSVSGTVTLNLKEVTVPEALRALREVYGYEYRRDDNRFFVLGRDMQTRLFNVNYLNMVRRGKSDTRVTATGLQATSAVSGTTTRTSTSQSGVQVETESRSDFWKELKDTLVALIGCSSSEPSVASALPVAEQNGATVSCPGGRNVVVNAQTGIVVVRAMPAELRAAEEYLGATHTTVNRQVVLEAKIIEVELNDRFQTGINWSKVGGNYTASQVGGGSPNLSTNGTTPFTGVSGTLLPGAVGSLQSSAALTNAFGGVFTLTAIGNDFTALLELLKAQGDIQVLSSPRISTVNNQKAVIKVGSDAFFVTKQDISIQTNASQVTAELTPFFSGISLDVTPQIDDAGNITLHIHPAVSNVTEKLIKTGTISIGGVAEPNTVSTALSVIQESDNVVRAKNGQVIVIGGLMKEGSTDENSSVPFLGDIPILGNLFKHKKITRIKKELVILLKPTVVQTDQDWDNAVGESQERIKKIRIGY